MFFHRKNKKKKDELKHDSAIAGDAPKESKKQENKHKKQYGKGVESSIDQTNLGNLKHHASFGNWIVKLLHLDPRHRMERRIVSYGCALFLIIFGMIICGFHDYSWHVQESETLTNYGSTAHFSKTSSPTMTLHHLEMTPDKRTAFVPISFDDMTQLSINAKKYGVFISAAQGSISYHPKGQFILFGNTGRGVIIIHDVRKLANQPVNIFLLNYTNLNNSGTESEAEDDGFNGNDSGIQQVNHDFDALHFKINPGAKDELINRKLSTDSSASDVYTQLFGRFDARIVTKENAHARKRIKVNENVSRDYQMRLKDEGFSFQKSKVSVPKWLNPSWRPFDEIEPNGVPKNKENSQNASSVASDGANSPLLSKTDTQDQGNYPAALKKKDGTTTSNAGGADSDGNDANDSDETEGGSEKGSHINGGQNNDPSNMWSNLKDAWDNILQLKHDIYTTNAATLYKIHATEKEQNQQASISKKFKVLKHFI